MTGKKLPLARPFRRDPARGCRNRLFGLMTIIGRGALLRSLAWRRRAWKYWAEFVMFRTRMLLRVQLKEALKAGTRMFRALALVTVWQKHCHRRLQTRFRAGGGEELIDDDLSAVGEVPELGFPEHHRVGCRDAVPVFEAKHASFGKGAVVDPDRCFGLGQTLEQ